MRVNEATVKCTPKTVFIGCLITLFNWGLIIITSLHVFSVDDCQQPSISVAEFRLPAHNYTPSTNSSAIYFDLKLRNKNSLTGFYYDHLNLTFSYGHAPPAATSRNITTLAQYAVPGFYQGYKKTAHRRDQVEILGAGAAVLGDNTTGRAVFVVDLVSVFNYKSMFGKSKTKKLVVSGNMELNYTTGEQIVLNNIKLVLSDSAAGFCGGQPARLLVPFTALILIAFS